jgi:L-alanine-DL-glutamate epimerase-like enolase superfamily enzyme
MLQAEGITIAGGEHAQDYSQLISMMRDGLLTVVQPDLAMIGGLTPIVDISIVADALGATVSPHFLPGLFVHVGAVSQSVRWLEEFPLLEQLFEGWPPIDEGTIAMPTLDRPWVVLVRPSNNFVEVSRSRRRPVGDHRFCCLKWGASQIRVSFAHIGENVDVPTNSAAIPSGWHEMSRSR